MPPRLAAAITTYTSPACWNAETLQVSSVNFEGIAANAGSVYFPMPAGITRNGVTFTINTAQSNGFLFVLGQGFTYPGISVLTTQQSTLIDNNMVITLPAQATSVSFIIGTNSPPATLKLSTGDTVTIQTLPFPQLAFFGVTSTQPFSSLQISNGFPNGFDIQTLSFGTSTPAPAITSVISAGGFGGFAAATPGSWVEIYGCSLAPDTRPWAGTDFNGNNAPTSLDKVQVTIGGQKAFVDYISSSPGQVNAQLPSNIPTGGALALTVTNGTQTSAPFNLKLNSTEAGLLAPNSFLIRGNQYVAALLPDGATYILPAGAIAGVTSRPAHPGEIITMYGIGFGPVTPAIPAGEIVTESNQLASSLQVLFGQTAAEVPYAGLAPGFVGLYQFDVKVPAVPDSDLVPLTFNLGGVPGTQKLFVAVHQ